MRLPRMTTVRWMTVELGFGMIVGLAFALARLNIPGSDPGQDNILEQLPWTAKIAAATESLLVGMLLVGGLTTWVERLRGRSPRPWGPGRWVWSILGLFVLFTILQVIADHFAVAKLFRMENPTLPGPSLLMTLRSKHAFQFMEITPRILLALGMTYLIAHVRTGIAPDAREIAGRTFAVLIVVVGLIVQILRLTGTPVFYVGGVLE